MAIVAYFLAGFIFAAAYKRWCSPSADGFDPLGGMIIFMWLPLLPIFLFLTLAMALYGLIPVKPKGGRRNG